MMRFIVDPLVERTADWQEVNRRHEEYLRYLRTIETRIPSSAFSFAISPWHHDVDLHQCLHDSWLEELVIAEIHPENNPNLRQTSIRVKLLGPYHDGHIYLEYVNVVSYELASPHHVAGDRDASRSHGDWLVDEVRLSPHHYVENEIVFSDGSRWLIECQDIRFAWAPLTSKGDE
jgi:hypothetical protein